MKNIAKRVNKYLQSISRKRLASNSELVGSILLIDLQINWCPLSSAEGLNVKIEVEELPSTSWISLREIKAMIVRCGEWVESDKW